MSKVTVIATPRDGSGDKLIGFEGKMYLLKANGLVTYMDAPSRYRIGEPVPQDLQEKINQFINK
jgi:hypothetical protein